MPWPWMRISQLATLSCVLAASACITEPPGTMLCPNPVNECTCENGADRGAVVVRWRISDAQAGQLLPRGECCCIPNDSPYTGLAGEQCKNYGSQCPKSPSWLIRKIQLHITPVDVERGTSCTVTATCTDGELQTAYCLPPGLYDLQVTADVDSYDKSCDQFVCSGRPAISPPIIRRKITAGQAVNLDGVVLGVNPPPTFPPKTSRGGACSSSVDAGARD